MLSKVNELVLDPPTYHFHYKMPTYCTLFSCLLKTRILKLKKLGCLLFWYFDANIFKITC